MSEHQSSGDRELSLVGKVEMRIALAETDAKLESLLNTYLVPLLLKLASDHQAVRNKVVAICHHVNTRIRPIKNIQLPIVALLKQFKETKASLVKDFDLIYIRQALERLDDTQRVALLPDLMGGSASHDSHRQDSQMFNLVLRLLPSFRLPPRGSAEESKLREKLTFSDEDAAFYSKWFTKLLLLVPFGTRSQELTSYPGLTPTELKFLNKDLPPAETWNPNTPGGLNLVETKISVARFLSSAAFLDNERFLSAVVMSADPDNRVSQVGEDIFKHSHFNLEDTAFIEQLYQLYLGDGRPDGAPPVRPALQTKILARLSNSIYAANQTAYIEQIIRRTLSEDEEQGGRGLEGQKLRSQIFSFINWITRMGSSSTLETVAPFAMDGLKNFLDAQGWPNPANPHFSTPELHARSLAYESIGILSAKTKRLPLSYERVDSDLELLRWFLRSLASDTSSGQISVSVDQGLGNLLNALATSYNSGDDSGGDRAIIQLFQDRLRGILLHHMSLRTGVVDPETTFNKIRSTRFAVLRFANRCLPYSDVQARWIDLMAAGGAISGDRAEVVEEGQKGLDPYWYRMLNPPKDGSWIVSSQSPASNYQPPQFIDLVKFLFGNPTDTQSHLDTLLPKRFISESADLTPPVGTSLESPYISDYTTSLPPAIAFAQHILTSEALSSAGTPLDVDPEWANVLDTKLATDEHTRVAVRAYLSRCDHAAAISFLNYSLAGFLRVEEQKTLQSHASTDFARCGDNFIDMCSSCSNDLLYPLAKHVTSPSLRGASLSNDVVTQDTASRIYGILGSLPTFDAGFHSQELDKYVTVVSKWKSAVGHELSQARGALLSSASLVSRMAIRGTLDTLSTDLVSKLIRVVFEILLESRDLSLRDAAHKALSQLSLANVITRSCFSDGVMQDPRVIVEKLLSDAKREKESAVLALGAFSLVFPSDSAEFTNLLSSVYSLHEIRRPEVQFSVGEALCTIALGWASKALISTFDIDAKWPQSSIPDAVLSDMLEKVLTDCKASKPSLRKASAIWLLCLVQYCGHRDTIQKKLRLCQSTFVWLLSDRDDIVQETGSRGLSLVYEMGNQELKDDLVRDLVRSFTSGDDDSSNGALRGGKVSNDTELFEPGALPTGGGKSVTTYKDIVGLASEVGDPSLVYRFMSLASNNAIWSSRAAFGRFGLSNVLSDSSVNGYLSQNPKLYPKLYRYRFDPNPNVQRSMTDIWNALVKDSNAVIEANFDAIISDLLRSILAGKEWRVRQASCAAIADLLQGRRIEKYEQYLTEILTKAFKVLDDIKESVRAAAAKLCQTLINIVIRGLEASGSADSKRSRLMLDHVIPFLLGNGGLESSAPEIQSYATTALIRIIKKSPARILRPYATSITEHFLGSLSSMEPQQVNFVQLNADKYGITSGQLDKMRLSAIQSSPIMEAVELHLLDAISSEDDIVMSEFANSLENTLRSAIGLPSKVGISRVIVALCSKTTFFRPYSDRFMMLMRKYVLDVNDTVSAAYSTCIGYLTRLASQEEVLKTIKFAQSTYLKVETTDDNARQRQVAGEIIHAMSKDAGDAMSKVEAAFLPFVFVAMHDTDEHVRKEFANIWTEHVFGTRIVTSLFLAEIVQLISDTADSHRWAIKHASALSLATLVKAFDSDDCIEDDKAKLIWPVLEHAIGGKTWEGKEKVLDGFVKFCLKTQDFRVKNEVVQKQMTVSSLPYYPQMKRSVQLFPD